MFAGHGSGGGATSPHLPSSGAQPAVVKGELQLEDVEFHYQMRPDNKVLTGLNLRIKPGTVCALVGRSGGGKSTIIQLLMRFYDPKAGRILLDGEDFKNLNLKWLHDCMGLVAQDAQLFAATVEVCTSHCPPNAKCQRQWHL